MIQISENTGKVNLLITDIAQLVTVAGAGNRPKTKKELDDVGIIENGAIAISGKNIVMVGETSEVAAECGKRKIIGKTARRIKAKGKIVMPGLVDPHSHLVHIGCRAHEYEAKIKGETYEDQHGKGKGIFYTVNMTRLASEEELYNKGKEILEKVVRQGTTTIEIKSGYGLNYEAEMKMLQVIKKLRESMKNKITIVPTFLGAHAISPEFKREEYIELIIRMMPEIKEKGLAEFCDIFCDKLAFTTEESLRILNEARKSGLKLKAHIDQTSNNGGYRLINELPMISADHMDFTDLEKLNGEEKSVTVLLPGVTLHLMEVLKKDFWSKRAQEFINRGLAVALSTDYNPGSCPCYSMQTIMKLAACLYRMTPAQIINASTINAAYAIDRANEIGSIEIGKKADVIICDVADYRDMVNVFGDNKVAVVIKNGKIVAEN